MVAISAMVSSLEIEGNEGRGMQSEEQKQIGRCVLVSQGRIGVILIVDGKGRAVGVMDPLGAGAALNSFTQGITFTPKKEVGNSLLE